MPTMTLCPHYAVQVQDHRRAVNPPRSGGTVLRRVVWPWTLRRWRLGWADAQEGDIYFLLSDWNSSVAGVLSMDWTDGPDFSGTIQVQFVPKTLRLTRTGYLSYDASVEVDEVPPV